MKLKQLLETLMTPNVQATLIDFDTDTEIATLKTSGFASLDDTIESREVKRWQITSPTAIKVVLGDPLTSSDDSGNTDPSDPGTP